MSTPGVVRYDVAGTVARITFDRPAAHNAMTWAMYDQLLTALDEVDGNPALRVVTLRGAGGHFVAGTDISQFESFASADDGVAYERRLEAIVARLEAVRVPTVAVVQGHAAGAGLLFAMACDLRVCTPDARFSTPIARTVGNTLSLASHARLVAHFGPSRMKSLLMTAGAMETIEARAIGFVTAVVEAERMDQHVDELTGKLAQLAPLTLRATKQLVARLLRSVIADDEDILREVYGSRDFHEGVSAFREKRSPSWEGK
ncbi:MAG TPA: enoyl-CoA hydratase [Gemmatimonadaceae bacterium]